MTIEAIAPPAAAAEAVRLCTMGCGRPADVRKNGRFSGPCSACRAAQSAADKAKAAAPKATPAGRKPGKVAKRALSPKEADRLRKEFEALLGKWAHVVGRLTEDPDLAYQVGSEASAKQAEAMEAAQEADTMGRAVFLLREALRLAWTIVPPAGFSGELAAAEAAVEEVAQASDLPEAAQVVLCDALHDLAFAQGPSNDGALRLFAARRAGQIAREAGRLHRVGLALAEEITAATAAVKKLGKVSDLPEAAQVVRRDALHDLKFAQERSNDLDLRLAAADRATALAIKAGRIAQKAAHQEWATSIGANAGYTPVAVPDGRFNSGKRIEYRRGQGDDRGRGGGRRKKGRRLVDAAQEEILSRTLAQASVDED